jgi:DNA adenine methylase
MKPFLKWVGGKTQIIDDVFSKFPTTINDYYEPFLGGGSVLLYLLQKQKEGKIKIRGKIIANDINTNLINVYKAIQKDPRKLIKELKKLTDTYNSCKEDKMSEKPKRGVSVSETDSLKSKEAYYYWIRDQYNKNSVIKEAQFIFLNKTCFRGVYRESKNGFNVPFGNYKNPSIYDENHILQISELIKDVLFINKSFENVIDNVQENDFVYLDPPYYPENEKSFVDYNSAGFDEKIHKKLFQCILGLKCKFVMSNSDVKFVREYFKNYKIETIVCKRSINSKNPSSKTNEIMVYN